MVEDPIYIVTDQDPGTGVGSYVDALFRLLRETFVGIQVLYVGCSPIGSPLGWVRPPGMMYAQRPVQIPSALRHNYRRVRSVISPESAVHFCGVSYALVPEHSRSVVTIHDRYPRRLLLQDLREPMTFLGDASALWQYLVLPRQIRNARTRIVPTRHVQTRLAENCSLSSTVIPHWVEPERFHAREKSDARRILGLPADEKLVLNVSRHTSNKGFSILSGIEARMPPGHRLVKAGGRLPAARSAIQMPYLSNEQYSLLFNACDMYLHTSSEEGFGYPLIQSMASGLPVVASKTEVSEEVLGEAALFVPLEPRTTQPWLSAMRALLDEDLRDRVVSRGFGRLAIFSPERARDAVVAVYRSAFGSRPVSS